MQTLKYVLTLAPESRWDQPLVQENILFKKTSDALVCMSS